MLFWKTWYKVLDPRTAEDWAWVNSIMGPRGPDRWMHIEHNYYFKHECDAMLFRLMFSEHTR